MIVRWQIQKPVLLSSRLTYLAWSPNNWASSNLQRFVPSTTPRGNLFDGFIFGLNIDQVPSACYIHKERLYEIAAPKSSTSNLNLILWSYKTWAWFFSQAEQFTTLKMTFGKTKTGYFRSRFRKYVFYHETAWLRRTFKHTSNYVFLNYGITVKSKLNKNVSEFFLRFNLFPVKFRPTSETLWAPKSLRTKNMTELFRRFRWSRIYGGYFSWWFYTSKVLRVNYSQDAFLEATRLWLFKYKVEREAKKKQKKRSRKKRLNTRFRRRRFGKKRSLLKRKNWLRTFQHKMHKTLHIGTQIKKVLTKRFSYLMFSFWKIFYLNSNQIAFIFNLYRRFSKYYKNKYKIPLFFGAFEFYVSRHLSYFLIEK